MSILDEIQLGAFEMVKPNVVRCSVAFPTRFLAGNFTDSGLSIMVIWRSNIFIFGVVIHASHRDVVMRCREVEVPHW